MRVGLVIYGSLETLSGGYLYDRKLVETLRAAGDTVEIFSLPWRGYAARLSDNFQTGWRRRLEHARLDILLQDELNHPSLLWVNRQVRRRRAYPVLSIVHHLRSSEAHPAPLRTLYARVEDSYLRGVDGYLFNSDSTRRAVEERVGAGRPSAVALPAAEHFPDLPGQGEILARAFRPGPLRVVFLGNLIPRKGLHDLIASLGLLPPGTCHLTVAGDPGVDPGYTRRIRRQAARLEESGLVHFAGRVAEEDLARLLRVSQVLVVPSQIEGFGIVYLEGFRFGLPAIAAARGGAGEIVRPGETGWLVEPGRPDEIARHLAGLAGDRSGLVRMARAARECADRHPTWAESMTGARQFLVRIVETHKNSTA